MPHYDYDKDYPFATFITNLGKYNEGALVGEWVKFPTTAEELKKVFERIGIGAKDDFGQTYEEWFITDYDCYVDGLYDLLGEYANMDEFFRQHDPQYAAEHPEEHAAKEEIYGNLMAGRISTLDEKLAALGQTQEDYLPSEIEKFKDATGYEECLDVDPQVIREAIENPDQSHVDEMLAFAEQANREYEAELYGQQAAPEKLTVLVVEPMKEPYVKEIAPGLHALQAEVGGDIAASYPFDDPVGLVLNDEGKLIGLDLNRSLRDEHGEIYDIVAGTFLVVGLSPENFVSLPPDMIQKYTEQFKRPELFASINGQIVSVPVEPENPLRTAEMTLEDDYGMIDGIINNGRRGEELEKAQAEAHRTTPEKKPSIRERLEDAKRECTERKGPDKPAPQKKPPELGNL